MSPTIDQISNLPQRLRKQLAHSDRRMRQNGRAWQRRWEPELAYGRHHGPIRPNARLASVLVLIYQRDGQWVTPLTRRAATLADHPSQISLPGGMLEPGETVVQAAFREWEEEMGCDAKDFEVLGELHPVFVFNSNFRIAPIVATASDVPDFHPNPAEVERVIELPLRKLLDPNEAAHQIIRRGLSFRAPHVAWEGERVWGATLQVLAELAGYLG